MRPTLFQRLLDYLARRGLRPSLSGHPLICGLLGHCWVICTHTDAEVDGRWVPGTYCPRCGATSDVVTARLQGWRRP